MLYGLAVADVAADETVHSLARTSEIGVAGVSERVEVADLARGHSSSASLTKAEPMKPVPPVTKSFFIISIVIPENKS